MKGVVYSARVTVHTPANYNRAKKAVKLALQKQIDGIGYSFVEFLSACPPSWRMTPDECWEFIDKKMLAEYPLGEFKNVDRID
jgi:2-oxoglutarate ferredoxin oxidoreductase subunit beta